ncbi:MAG: ParB/RepB/Spo0J family partition protein [Patescibacteria group bacterium]|nr:ParB/RepB/Spo0J family partition protein [Patescibacteria group bacterium]
MPLGKGLESLIPPNNSRPQGDNANPPQPQYSVEIDYKKEVFTKEEPLGGGNNNPPQPASREQKSDYVFQIEVEKIRPNPEQPRKEFDEESLRNLAVSIREFGIIQPLVVSKVEVETENGQDVFYQLIAGHRRLLASKIAGLERVPAIVKNVDLKKERLELAIIENIQRENLNPIEIARAYSRLSDEFNLTQREIGARLGKSREAVANALRLLSLPSKIQEAVSGGKISESHARLLMAINDSSAQDALFEELLRDNFSVQELKRKVNEHRQKSDSPKEETGLPPEILMMEKELSSRLKTPVSIQSGDKGGKITIHFYSPEELAQILNSLGNPEKDSY